MRVELKKFLEQDKLKNRAIRCGICKLPARTQADILELSKAGATQAQMLRFLDAQGLASHPVTLKTHLSRHANAK